jgi:stalled ribosome alternative rescue factor ArfA
MSRGMVKWNAFNALVDQGERLARLRVDRQRQPKPQLSQQQKEELDSLLQEAWSTKAPVCITYYHEGFFQDIRGLITKVQPTERTISIDKKQYRVSEIVAMNLLKED